MHFRFLTVAIYAWEFFLRIQCVSDLPEQLSSRTPGKQRKDCAVALVSVEMDLLLTSKLIHVLHYPAPRLGSGGCSALPVLLWHTDGMLDVWKIVYKCLLTSTS